MTGVVGALWLVVGVLALAFATRCANDFCSRSPSACAALQLLTPQAREGFVLTRAPHWGNSSVQQSDGLRVRSGILPHSQRSDRMRVNRMQMALARDAGRET
jgi:hypothetical protein